MALDVSAMKKKGRNRSSVSKTYHTFISIIARKKVRRLKRTTESNVLRGLV